MKKTPTYLPLVFVAVCLAGCGPSIDVGLTMQQVATNIVYGGHKKPAPPEQPPPPAAALVPGFPPFIGAPPSAPVPGVPEVPFIEASPVPCPVAGPFDAPLLAATTTMNGAPAKATYRYKVQGSGTKTDFQGKVTTLSYPSSATWEIQPDKPAAQPDGTTTYTFKVVETAGDQTITTSYTANNGHSLSQGLPVAPPTAPPKTPDTTGQLAITKVQVDDSTGSSVFSPQPNIEILPLAALGGATWSGTSSDPAATGGPQTWQYQGQIGDYDPTTNAYVPGTDKGNVDACGHVLQGWNVRFSATVNAGSTNLPQKTITAQYLIATQYGGLTVRVTSGQKGSDPSAKMLDFQSTESAQELPQPAQP